LRSWSKLTEAFSRLSPFSWRKVEAAKAGETVVAVMAAVRMKSAVRFILLSPLELGGFVESINLSPIVRVVAERYLTPN
jgi:hypothetical protein